MSIGLLAWLSWVGAYWQWIVIGLAIVAGGIFLTVVLKNWRPAVVAVVVVALGLAAQGLDANGFKRAEARCQEARLRGELARANEQLAKANADLKAARDAAADEKKRGEELDALARQNEEKARALEDEVAKRPADKRCRATDDDIRRLR